jgi:hypothetical protein
MGAVIHSVKARLIRVTALDDSGRARGGPCGVITSSGFVSVTATPEYEQGESRNVRNIWGQRCESWRESDELVRVNLSVLLCEVDPALIALIAEGVTVIPDQLGDAIGMRLHAGRSDAPRFTMELWSKNVADDCEPDSWIHWVFPRVRAGALSVLNYEHGPLTIGVAGQAEEATSAWRYGPYVPAPAPAPVLAGDMMVMLPAVGVPPAPVGCDWLAIDERADTEASPDAPIRYVGSTPPADPDQGDEFLLLPENHLARWTGTEWAAVSPRTGNLAATLPAPAPPPAPPEPVADDLEVVNV